MIKNLSFLFIILFICGCSSSKKIIISDALDSIPVVTGSVVNPSAFGQGGTLALGSFKPGPGAEADDETDELSSLMIKGIKDTLPAENAHFTISANAIKDSDCFLDGHIKNYSRKGHFAHLSVEGEIWLQETGEKIFLFDTSSVIDLKVQSPKTTAYQIGVAVAHYIGSRNS